MGECGHNSVFFSHRAIVFVVDSVSFQKEVKDVAEFLYMLLTDAVIVKNAPPFLIACNKQGEVIFVLFKRFHSECSLKCFLHLQLVSASDVNVAFCTGFVVGRS